MTNNTKNALVAGAVGVVIGVGGTLLYQKLTPLTASGDEPIIMAGGSLYIQAMGLSMGHHYGFGPDSPGSRSLTYQKDHRKANGHVSKIEIAYANNGAPATDVLTPAGQSTVTYGYCAAMCTSPTADDIVTLRTNEEDLSTHVQSVTISSSVTDMTKDTHVDDTAWSHLPEMSHLYWVSINGSPAYTCLPGPVECQVIIHYTQ